jgi:HEAT repeat protein
MRGHSIWALLMAACLSAAADAETFPAKYYPPADRALAATWLGKLKAKQALAVLLKLCDDADGAVQTAAIEALGKIGDEAATPVLERIAGDVKRMRIPGASPFRGEWWRWGGELPRTSTHNAQRAAQWALLKIPDNGRPREAQHAIADLAKLDRAAVARYCRGSGAKKYYESQLCKSDNEAYSRAWFAMDIIAPTPGPRGTAALLDVLGCGNENLEMRAAYALADRPAAHVLTGLRRVLKREDLSNLTLSACLHVVLKHDPPAAAALGRRLVTRLASADDFARFPHREQELLLRALKRDDVPLLKTLRDARTLAVDRAAVDRLIDQVVGRAPPADFFDAVDIAPEFRAEAVRLFLEAVRHPERDWRTFRAMYQLGRLRVKEAVPDLLRHLEYDGQGSYVATRGSDLLRGDKGVASYYQPMAGWALVQIGDTQVIPKLRELALDAKRPVPVRSAAILAYARLAKAAAIDDLRRVLAEPDARFLGGTSTRRAEPALEFPDFHFARDAAAWALADLGGEPARAVLVTYVNSGQPLSWDLAHAVRRVAPDTLDGWSVIHVKSMNADDRRWGVTLRYAFFPESAAPVVRPILANPQDPLYAMTIEFLGRHAVSDRATTRLLVDYLARDKEAPTCNQRIRLIEAIGRQGGEDAITALTQFALQGRIGAER